MKYSCYRFLVLSVLLVISTPRVFAESSEAGTGPNPFRDCGIGAALFPETHWAAVTSNIIWDVGITAVTSATSSPETCSGANVETAQFIIDNYDNLVEETAQGHGEYLTTVLEIKGCEVAMQADTVAAIRTEMAWKVASSDYVIKNQVEKASEYYSALNKALSSSCSS